MPRGEGGSTSGNTVDAPWRPGRRRLPWHSTEAATNPGNLAFNRRVAELEATQKRLQKEMNAAIFGSLNFKICYPFLEIWGDPMEDEESTQNDDISNIPGTSTPPRIEDRNQKDKGRDDLDDSTKPPDDEDFLEGTFLRINSDKKKATTTRNKKSSKKQKKKKGKGKGKGKGKKQSQDALEIIQSEPPIAAVAAGESFASSSSHVAAVCVPPLEYSSSSSSSRVTAKLIVTSAVKSASSGNEKEQLSASSSNDDFKSLESTTSYATAASRSSVNDCYTGTGNAWNSTTKGDYAGSLSDARSERSLSASDSAESRGFKKMSGEGNKPNVVHQSFSSAVGRGCSQEALLCSDYASNDGGFQKVVSRKSAQKLKRLQRLESPAPSSTSTSTMAASGSRSIVTPAVVPARAPFRQVVTIGHYLNDDTFYGKQPNQKKGKYQKARSLSNLSKTDGDNVSGSKRVLVITTTVQPAIPRSSHHVTLEAIEETHSPSHLPNEGDLKAKTPFGDGIKDTDSMAPSSEKSSSHGSLANSSCVNREEQKEAVVLVGGDTKDTRAPLSDKTSSLGHLDSPSCADKEEQKTKAVALVGGGTEDTYSRAATSSKTLSLCHLAISSSADDSEEQKKEENRIAFSTHASSQLDKIIEAANNAYEIQAASDVFMTSGIHADIENFLYAATPVIGQIPCTKSNISLQDQRLWSVWSWYEEPECCGIEVQMQGKTNSIWPEFSTYFQPLLSAVQLFGQSGKSSQNHGGLIFEYFESESPYSRPQFFTKIKQLLDGVNLSGNNPIFGDPKQLESVKLSDLHPASWYSVAWYPICQIPAAAGRCQTSFLTYHSLGKLVPQTCPTDQADGHDGRIICPIVGLLGYKDQSEKWFQLREQLKFKEQLRLKPTPNNVSSETDHAELLNKRLRTLRQGASTLSKAVVPRASGEAMNYHSDYVFFCSRSR